MRPVHLPKQSFVSTFVSTFVNTFVYTFVYLSPSQCTSTPNLYNQQIARKNRSTHGSRTTTRLQCFRDHRSTFCQRTLLLSTSFDALGHFMTKSDTCGSQALLSA